LETLTKKKIKEIAKAFEAAENSTKKTEVLSKYEDELFKPKDRMAVLGVDIYRYSQYASVQQAIIPHLFKELWTQTIENILIQEPFIFQKYDKKILDKNFIDTGDGGFQIFNNPFDAVIFAVFFQLSIHRYNSSHRNDGDDLFGLIGELKLRYAITFDSIYEYEGNQYGAAVINNARILAKDKLDRCLLDQNVVDWFFKELNGFENLAYISNEDLHIIGFFEGYNKTIKNEDTERKGFLFIDKKSGLSKRITSADIMHIGEVQSKLNKLSVHSAYIRINVTSKSLDKKLKKMASSLGSLNPEGIRD
jgi:hypothetical protein